MAMKSHKLPNSLQELANIPATEKRVNCKTNIKKVLDVLIECGFSPAQALVTIAERGLSESENETYHISVRQQFLTMAQRASAELLEYTQPKLSRSELTWLNGEAIEFKKVDDMTDDELARIAAAGSSGAFSTKKGKKKAT